MARGHASSVINAPIEQVWAHIRDFNGLADWHPGIAKSEIEGGGPSDRVGCIRVLTLQDGGVVRERLLEMSDLGHHYSYSILDSPLPVANYRATLRLRRVVNRHGIGTPDRLAKGTPLRVMREGAGEVGAEP